MRAKEIPLKIEHLSADAETEFLISDPIEILTILQTIAQRKHRVALYYNDASSMFLTMLLAAEQSGIWIDATSSKEDNRLIERSRRIVLVSTYNQAKIQIVASDALLSTYADEAAFSLALPRKLVRLQRRDYYRAPTRIPAPTCIMRPLPEQPDLQHEIAVVDISIGGIALLCDDTGLDLKQGMIYKDCRLVLPEFGNLQVTLEIKNSFEVTSRSGKTRHRVGCIFVNPDRNTMMQLQRYVARMQTQRELTD